MDVAGIFEIITTNPLCYFVLGVVAGYLLRVYLIESRGKRLSRYDTKKFSSAKRPAKSSELNEPSFDLPDGVLKTLHPQQLRLDQNGNDF